MFVCYYFLNLLRDYEDTLLMSMVVCKHAISKEDKILIKNLLKLKGYNAEQLAREFPSKGWNVGSVYKLLQKLWVTETVDCRPSSSKQCSACTADNIDLVDKPVLSQEDNAQSRRTVHEICLETGIH